MRDTEIFTAIRAALLAGFEGWEHGPVAVERRGQNVGAATGPTLYMQVVAAPPIGSPQRDEIWNEEAEEFIHRERQKMGVTVQISGLFRDGGEDATAGDLVQMAAGILRAVPALTSIRAAGAGVQGTSPVRNPMFRNGQDAFEFDPNFDLVLTHEQITLSKTPGAVATDVRVVSV